MTEHVHPEIASESKIPTTDELIEAYVNLSSEDLASVQAQAAELRSGPTGLGVGESILAVMADRLDPDPDSQP